MRFVLRAGGFRFFFYSNEGNPREPVHIHARQGRDEAKFWLRPDVRMAYNDGLSARDLNRAERLVQDHRDLFERAWNEHFA